MKNHFFRIFMIVKFLCSARASCFCLRDIRIRVHAACTHHVNKTRAREFIFLTYHIWAFLWVICDMSQITSRNRPVQKFLAPTVDRSHSDFDGAVCARYLHCVVMMTEEWTWRTPCALRYVSRNFGDGAVGAGIQKFAVTRSAFFVHVR